MCSLVVNLVSNVSESPLRAHIHVNLFVNGLVSPLLTTVLRGCIRYWTPSLPPPAWVILSDLTNNLRWAGLTHCGQYYAASEDANQEAISLKLKCTRRTFTKHEYFFLWFFYICIVRVLGFGSTDFANRRDKPTSNIDCPLGTLK
jgi:hypothetical protein